MRRKVHAVGSIPEVPEHVVGLDLSLTGAAACALPLDWNGRISWARTGIEGYRLSREASPKERVERLAQLVEFVRLFCLNARAKQVFVEDYAYHQTGALTTLGELNGAVKLTLFSDHDIVVVPVVAASARKTLLQRVPRLGSGKTKPFVIRNVKRLKGQTERWSEDECDAFVIANHGLGIAGGTPVSFPPECESACLLPAATPSFDDANERGEEDEEESSDLRKGPDEEGEAPGRRASVASHP